MSTQVNIDTKSAIAGQYNQSGTLWHSLKTQGSAHRFLEKPAIYSMLPQDLHGKKVLCFGCGYGEECFEIKQQGAREVVGIDISASNVENAVKKFPEQLFLRMDMESLAFADASFDLIFSSLSLHYLENWDKVLGEAHRVLSKGGELIVSTHHPATWGAEKTEDAQVKKQILGYQIDKDTNNISLFGDYLSDRKIDGTFSGKFNVTFYHKSFSSMLRAFRQAGFELLDCQEPLPLPEAKQADPTFEAIRSHFPLFVIFKLMKISNQSHDV